MIYAGITVGPIFDTINLATKPAALWFASSLFSDFTRRVCKAIEKEFGEKAKIYSPFYDDARYGKTSEDGVGKFHDRIIFSVDGLKKDELKERLTGLLNEVKKYTAKSVLPEEKSGQGDFFVDYIRTPFILLEANEEADKNINLFISPYLDDLELMPAVRKSASEYGPLYEMLTDAGDSGTNSAIKKSPLFRAIEKENNQFKKNNDSFWSIEEIASAKGTIKNGLKRTDYFAVIAADGDGMGRFLKELDGNKQLIDFSEACIKYDENAAQIVGDHKAITIYAGGDDLLILSPVVDKDEYGSNVLNLCDDIREAFRYFIERFKDENDLKVDHLPSLSFGISIQYYKFPLYQAIADARTLLDKVKKEKNGRKDAVAIHVRKHSGQSFGIMLDEDIQPRFEEFLTMRVQSENDDRLLTSVIKNLTLYSGIIKIADEEYSKEESMDLYSAVWGNLFDNINQKKYKPYLDQICKWYWHNIVRDQKSYSSEEDKDYSPAQIRDVTLGDADRSSDYDRINVFLDMLRISKFLIEKEGSR